MAIRRSYSTTCYPQSWAILDSCLEKSFLNTPLLYNKQPYSNHAVVFLLPQLNWTATGIVRRLNLQHETKKYAKSIQELILPCPCNPRVILGHFCCVIVSPLFSIWCVVLY